MTRKDYQLIAFAMCDMRATPEQAAIMADALWHTNPRFDRDRFISACLTGQDGNARN